MLTRFIYIANKYTEVYVTVPAYHCAEEGKAIPHHMKQHKLLPISLHLKRP